MTFECGCAERKKIVNDFCSKGGHIYVSLGIAGAIALYLLLSGVAGTVWLAIVALLVFGVFLELRGTDRTFT